MSGVQFDIKVVTGGNAAIDGVINGVTTATTRVNSLTSAISKIGAAAFAFNNIKSAVGGIADDFKAAIQPGIDFNDNLKDLQAITGVSDEQLKKIGNSARDNAKAFGVDASAAVESYKLILSQLGPEIGNNDVALAAMGKNASILSKQLGGDVAGATGILTTAMNQYGVSLADPMAASNEMANMMNIMSAAAKEGSAELPQIKSALEQSGLMAKTSGVQFSELNAAIQVLDKAGKKGAEGGVAIRNVLAEIGQGSRMPKIAAAAFDQYGISTAALGDKTKTMAERLALIRPMMNDTSAMTAVFGKENVAAAIALVQNTDEIGRLDTAVQGSNTAVDMANTKMGSYKEVMARVSAAMKDVGISIFNATEPLLPFLSIAGGGMKILGDFGMAAQGVSVIAETKFGAAIGKAATATLGFIKNMALGTLGLIRQAGQMAISAAMTVGGFVVSLVAATAAQIGLNIAMTANPIGLIVVGIAAAIAAVALMITYWDEIWGAIKAATAWVLEHNPFSFLVDVVDNIFPGFKAALTGLWDWVEKKFTDLINWFKETWNSIKGVFGMDDATITATTLPTAAVDGAAVESDVVLASRVAMQKKMQDEAVAKKQSKTSKEMATNVSGGGSKPTTINLTIHKLQDQIVVHTTNLQTGAKEAGRQIVEEILLALNSVNGKAAAL